MSTRRHKIVRVEGDVKPDLSVEYKNFDLTGFTIKLHATRISDKCQETVDGIIDDATGGLFHFEFTPSDLLLVRGLYDAEIEFEKAGASFTIPRQVPLLIEVRENSR